jgi:hypothetical protein
VAPFLSAADNALLSQIDANETAINAARTANGIATPLYAGTAAPANAAGIISANVNRRVIDINQRINNMRSNESSSTCDYNIQVTFP